MNTNSSGSQEKTDANITLKVLAWGAILIISVPPIIYRMFEEHSPGEPITPFWLAVTQVVVLVVLWAVTWVWASVKPLQGFVLALIKLAPF